MTKKSFTKKMMLGKKLKQNRRLPVLAMSGPTGGSATTSSGGTGGARS